MAGETVYQLVGGDGVAITEDAAGQRLVISAPGFTGKVNRGGDTMSGPLVLNAGVQVKQSFVALVNGTFGYQAGGGQVGVEAGAARTADGAAYFGMRARPGAGLDAAVVRQAGVDGTLDVQQSGAGAINLQAGAGGVAMAVAGQPQWSVDGRGYWRNTGRKQPRFMASGASAGPAVTYINGYTSVVDSGAGFNAASGIYTAPESGFYLLSVWVRSTNGPAAVAMFRSGQAGGAVVLGCGTLTPTPNVNGHGTMSGVIELFGGDQLYLQVTGRDGGLTAVTVEHFSGVMLF